MKLLFDENLSRRLVGALADIYPESLHVEDVGLLGAPDREIWDFAAANGFLLVSKDTDFYERSVLYGAPPKLIWLRIGNASVRDTAALLRDNYIIVRRFHDESESSFLALPTIGNHRRQSPTMRTDPTNRWFEGYEPGSVHEFGSIRVEEAEVLASGGASTRSRSTPTRRRPRGPRTAAMVDSGASE